MFQPIGDESALFRDEKCGPARVNTAKGTKSIPVRGGVGIRIHSDSSGI